MAFKIVKIYHKISENFKHGKFIAHCRATCLERIAI